LAGLGIFIIGLFQKKSTHPSCGKGFNDLGNQGERGHFQPNRKVKKIFKTSKDFCVEKCPRVQEIPLSNQPLRLKLFV